MLEFVIFFFFAAVAVIFALVVILHPNPVVGALSLVASFFALAVMYVLLDAPVASNIQWLTTFGEGNRATLDWWARHRRYPAVVFIEPGLLARAGGLEAAALKDPLMAYLAAHYRVVDPAPTAGPVVLLRR